MAQSVSKLTVHVGREGRGEGIIKGGVVEERRKERRKRIQKEDGRESPGAAAAPSGSSAAGPGSVFPGNLLKTDLAVDAAAPCHFTPQPCPNPSQRNSCTGDHRDALQWTSLC